MSGARALASARRRRAEPQGSVAPISSSKITNNMTSIQDENSEQQKPKMSPAMMLLSHNKIIENLQTVIENLNSKLEQQEKNVKKMIEDCTNNSQIDDTNLEYYKSKIVTIDNSLEEIKKHTLKVQTFSMETNLQVVEVKKRLNKYENKQQDNQDKQREQIIEHINKVSIILTKIDCEVEQSKEVQKIQNSTLVDILQGMNNNVTGENIICGIDDEKEVNVEETNQQVDDSTEVDGSIEVDGSTEVDGSIEVVDGRTEVDGSIEVDGNTEVDVDDSEDEEGEDSAKLNF